MYKELGMGNKSIVVSTLLSVLLHAMLLLAGLLWYPSLQQWQQAGARDHGVKHGPGLSLEITLHAAKRLSPATTAAVTPAALATDQPAEQPAEEQAITMQTVKPDVIDGESLKGETGLAASMATASVARATMTQSSMVRPGSQQKQVATRANHNLETLQQVNSEPGMAPDTAGHLRESVLTMNEQAESEYAALLQLLRNRINDNKHYPRVALRQQREGIARVGFILESSGIIRDVRLISSSNTASLDRAALAAVNSVERLQLDDSPLNRLLNQAHEFEINISFRIL